MTLDLQICGPLPVRLLHNSGPLLQLVRSLPSCPGFLCSSRSHRKTPDFGVAAKVPFFFVAAAAVAAATDVAAAHMSTGNNMQPATTGCRCCRRSKYSSFSVLMDVKCQPHIEFNHFASMAVSGFSVVIQFFLSSKCSQLALIWKSGFSLLLSD